MKYLKLFENFENEPIEGEFIETNDLESDDYDEQLEKDLSIELEYKLRTLEDESEFTIDDFLMEFGINPEEMTGFAWAAILNGTEEYKEMSDEEFMSLYDDYKLESTLEPNDLLDYEIDDDINEATSGSVDNKNSKAYKSLKKKSEASGIGLTILKQVYKRGMAAWNAGHRPGTPQNAWAMGRVNSFVTGAGGARKADSDLWKKAKKQKSKKKK
jgi:hypothetical protein